MSGFLSLEKMVVFSGSPWSSVPTKANENSAFHSGHVFASPSSQALSLRPLGTSVVSPSLASRLNAARIFKPTNFLKDFPTEEQIRAETY